MKTPSVFCSVWVMIVGFAATVVAAAEVSSGNAREIVSAVRRNDCDSAVNLAREAANSRDNNVALVVGRMLEEGVCVQPDAVAATAFFERAADSGDHTAALEYAAQIGLGEGLEQSYERAGELCVRSGLPAQGLSAYSLGYVCTLRTTASRLLRESLPRAAFAPNSGAAQLTFNPARAAMQVRATPHVARGEATTGTNIRRPVIDARQVIQRAWSQALSNVPKPDASRLDDRVVHVTLDLDMTIEGFGRDLNVPQAQPSGSFLPGDVHPRTHMTTP